VRTKRRTAPVYTTGHVLAQSMELAVAFARIPREEFGSVEVSVLRLQVLNVSRIVLSTTNLMSGTSTGEIKGVNLSRWERRVWIVVCVVYGSTKYSIPSVPCVMASALLKAEFKFVYLT
jgi:hypothetical protein